MSAPAATESVESATTPRGWLALPFAWLKAALNVTMVSLVLLSFALVVARYAFGNSSVAGQEALQWLNALCFMFGAVLAVRFGGHVRVDLLYARWSKRAQARVDLLGTLFFLLPFAAFMLWISLDYVAASVQMREASQESGGLPAVYALKALIPITGALLIVQGLAELVSAWLRMRKH
ncbi:MAG: TRAP transporter small permease subunit [Pseudomarimonas sp.]